MKDRIAKAEKQRTLLVDSLSIYDRKIQALLTLILSKLTKAKNKEEERNILAEFEMMLYLLISKSAEKGASLSEDRYNSILPTGYSSRNIDKMIEGKTLKDRISEISLGIAAVYKKPYKITIEPFKGYNKTLFYTKKTSIAYNVSRLHIDTTIRNMNNANIFFMRKKKAIGYYGKRGSSYDCPLCDSLCNIIYPLTSMIFPAHPRCLCLIIEVFRDETI